MVDAEGVAAAGFDLPGDDGDVFFDTRAWLDSDCEEYFSIYDETTPSRTPIHPSIHIDRMADLTLETPSSEPKKLLIELLQESDDSDPGVGDRAIPHTPTAPGTVDPLTISHDRASNSVWSSEMTLNSKPLKARSPQSSPCCLPNLVRNLSINERRKRLSTLVIMALDLLLPATGSKCRLP